MLQTLVQYFFKATENFFSNLKGPELCFLLIQLLTMSDAVTHEHTFIFWSNYGYFLWEICCNSCFVFVCSSDRLINIINVKHKFLRFDTKFSVALNIFVYVWKVIFSWCMDLHDIIFFQLGPVHFNHWFKVDRAQLELLTLAEKCVPALLRIRSWLGKRDFRAFNVSDHGD